MDLMEGVGESSSPPRSFGCFSNYDVRNDVYTRLVEGGHEEAVSNPELFREQLDAHFNRLPASYGLDVNMDRVDDVVLHQKLLALAKDSKKQPVYFIRFVENHCTKTDGDDNQQLISDLSSARPACDADDDGVPALKRENVNEFEPCSKLEDLNLDVRKTSKGLDEKVVAENLFRRCQNNFECLETECRKEILYVPIHEVIFSTIDKPKLLSQLSALLSDIGLNIREAHVFSTTDGYSLDVFVVDGWPDEDTDGLHEAIENTIARSEGSWSGPSCYRPALGKVSPVQVESGDWEINRRLLKREERIAAGSCGDLYRGVYLGQDVAVKIIRSEHLTDTQKDEFAQEVAILREVQHENIVRFIGACTNSPDLCIVTEYMPGGSLYDYLHRNNILKLPQLLKFAIDVCKGMRYLHQNNIIHRDLKTANLLMDTHNVVKVADFGVARFQNQGGVMTAETGTYRWMAPEVINHEPYDQKADIFSFAIVLWELVTAKVPYDTMSPLQAALGVRQGLRPDLPQDAHPRLLDLMQRCWEAIPEKRPSFSEVLVELEAFLQEAEETTEALNGN